MSLTYHITIGGGGGGGSAGASGSAGGNGGAGFMGSAGSGGGQGYVNYEEMRRISEEYQKWKKFNDMGYREEYNHLKKLRK